jgi:hypothetical protein
MAHEPGPETPSIPGALSRIFHAAASDLPLLFQHPETFYARPARLTSRAAGRCVRPIGDRAESTGQAASPAGRAASPSIEWPLQTAPDRRRNTPPRRATTMFDLAMLALGCGFFVLSIWYAIICERL